MRNRYASWATVVAAGLLLASMTSAQAADVPVASAPIPPPPPDIPHVVAPNPPPKAAPVAAPKHEGAKQTKATKPPSPASAAAAKKAIQTTAHMPTEHKTAAAQRSVRSKRPERRQLFARAYPPRPPMHRYYPGDFIPGAGGDAPPFPPPWYYGGPPRGPW